MHKTVVYDQRDADDIFNDKPFLNHEKTTCSLFIIVSYFF